MRLIHDLDKSLKSSHDESDNPVWEEIYRKAFPDFETMVDHRDNGYWQEQGIDRSIILKSSKQILIDEKVRFPNKETGIVYNDILLEYLSCEERNTPGWVCKPLMADYIAYCIKAKRTVYLLPIQQLQVAWTQQGSEWKTVYGNRRTQSKRGDHTWTTVNCPVPVDILFKAIGQALRIKY